MADMSLPPLGAPPSPGLGYAWPAPDLPGYAPPGADITGDLCEIEGLKGQRLVGRVSLFDPGREVLLLRAAGARTSAPVRFEQFRRLRMTVPLTAQVQAGSTLPAPVPVPVRVKFKGGAEWQGQTCSHREMPYGLFLFEPATPGPGLHCAFLPRAAYDSAEVGHRLGETLVSESLATPEQIDAALAEQQAMRQRKLGDLLLARQIITGDELTAAIEQQAKMPMVRIGEALLALGFITQAQLDEALAQQKEDRSLPLGEVLVRQEAITRADLQTALSRKMGYPLVDVTQFVADAAALAKLPYALASRVPALPLTTHGGRLVVALEDPSNRAAIDEIEFAAQCKIMPVLARSGTLQAVVEKVYEKIGAATGSAAGGKTPRADAPAPEFDGAEAKDLLASLEQVEEAKDEEEGPTIAQSDNSLVRLINSMILEAQSQNVSDIHVECPAGRQKVRIRFRRDGQMRPYLELPHGYRQALLARIKIMCDLDISEKRKPQDGKISFSKYVNGSRLELRVATIPTQGGLEDAVLRLLASAKPLPIEQLGLSPANLERFKSAVQRPNGMVLCVGPTGSGKTTTLHSAMGYINTPERKIWTAEDPIEITQNGLRQVQVNPKIDWTFARALRAFLRADPDVIMVGEIRDQETAQVAVEASLTGHLVMSTLHTNSAPETVTRLLDMGMDPFNFADALLLILAQRLVRRLCSHCKQPYEPDAVELDELVQDYRHAFVEEGNKPAPEDLLAQWHERFAVDGRMRLYRAVGCPKCDGNGYRGRAGIHEMMGISRTVRHLIQTGARAEELMKAAQSDGLRTLRQDGIEKVLAGATTIDEVRASS
jgi:type II secretory ATPase GspE/PulE/Tfp pilus assembly ATPase PilB-like protein